MNMSTKEIMEWAIEKLNSYDKERKLYNISGIILSILDVICGIIALYYASMQVTSVVASILCGTVWGSRCIQLIKTRRLAKALKVLSTASITYILVRKKRSEYMKTILQNIKNNPITIIFAFIGSLLMSFVAYKFAEVYFATQIWVCVVFAIIVAIITIVSTILLGWDSVKDAILRTSKKKLSSENYNKVLDLVNTLEKAELDAKKSKEELIKTENEKAKEIEQAKVIIANYEAQKNAYENAKIIVANSETKDIKNEIVEDSDL